MASKGGVEFWGSSPPKRQAPTACVAPHSRIGFGDERVLCPSGFRAKSAPMDFVLDTVPSHATTIDLQCRRPYLSSAPLWGSTDLRGRAWLGSARLVFNATTLVFVVLSGLVFALILTSELDLLMYLLRAGPWATSCSFFPSAYTWYSKKLDSLRIRRRGTTPPGWRARS